MNKKSNNVAEELSELEYSITEMIIKKVNNADNHNLIDVSDMVNLISEYEKLSELFDNEIRKPDLQSGV